MEKFLKLVNQISHKVYKQLSGLKEEHFQTALGVEFRKNKIDFMREAGLELFYDNHPIGLHELDFLIPPCMDLKEALVAKDRRAGGPTAPAAGLYLTDVCYPDGNSVLKV